MTSFELIIFVLIYCFCYGYANRLLYVEYERFADRLYRIIASFIIAIYVPVIIGFQIANKLYE